MRAAFTLLELLCAIAVVALLVSIAIPATNRATLYAARTKSIANLRQLGVAVRLYANEHNQKLPGQVADPLLALPGMGDASPTDRWPKLLCVYLTPSDPRVFLDPLNPAAAMLSPADILSNTVNNTGYVYNGFDDLSQDGQPMSEIPVTVFDSAVNVALMSQKSQGAKAFYVDLLLSPLDLLFSVLNPTVYDGGSYYLYLDGSVRFLKKDQYSNNIWLTNKDLTLPPLLNNNGAPHYAQMSTPPRGAGSRSF